MNTERDFLAIYTSDTKELCHHGILGQKWGIRRFQNKDGSLTPEGRKRWGIKSINNKQKERLQTERVKNRSEQDKKMIQEIQDWEDNEREHLLRGKQLIHQINIAKYKFSRIFDDVDAKADLPKLKVPDTPEEAVSKTNISKDTHLATGNNCCLCTIAYDLRRRGYDVISNQNAPINLLYDIGPEDVSWMYDYPKETHTKTSEGLTKALSKQPDGSRGAAFCSWSGGQGGHVVAYEVHNGKPKLYDAQTGDIYDDVSDLFDDVSDTSFIRLDDKEPNYNFVKIAVE